MGILAVAFSLWIIRSFLVPVAVAAFLAILLNPVRASERSRFRRHPRLHALLFTLGALLLIVTPIGLSLWLIVREILQAVALLHGALGSRALERLLQPIARAAARIGPALPTSAADLHKELSALSQYVAPTVGRALALSGHAALNTMILSVALFYFVIDGERLATWLNRVLPWAPRYSQELYGEFRKVSFGMVVGTLFSMSLSGVLAWLGYLVLGVSDPLVWGTLTGVFVPHPIPETQV